MCYSWVRSQFLRLMEQSGEGNAEGQQNQKLHSSIIWGLGNVSRITDLVGQPAAKFLR